MSPRLIALPAFPLHLTASHNNRTLVITSWNILNKKPAASTFPKFVEITLWKRI